MTYGSDLARVGWIPMTSLPGDGGGRQQQFCVPHAAKRAQPWEDRGLIGVMQCLYHFSAPRLITLKAQRAAAGSGIRRRLNSTTRAVFVPF